MNLPTDKDKIQAALQRPIDYFPKNRSQKNRNVVADNSFKTLLLLYSPEVNEHDSLVHALNSLVGQVAFRSMEDMLQLFASLNNNSLEQEVDLLRERGEIKLLVGKPLFLAMDTDQEPACLRGVILSKLPPEQQPTLWMLTRFSQSRDALSTFLTLNCNSRVLMEVKTIGPEFCDKDPVILVKYINFYLEGG